MAKNAAPRGDAKKSTISIPVPMVGRRDFRSSKGPLGEEGGRL